MTSRQSSLDSISNKSASRARKKSYRHDCGREVRAIQCTRCGYRHMIPIGSRDRTCPACAKYFYDRIFHRYRSLVKGMDEPKFLTLTWKPVRHQDPKVIRDIGKAFNRLLHRKPYRKIWKAELATVECKKTKEGFFYYHVHCILDGKYVPQKEISDDWREISGFPIVHIQRIWRTTERAFRYVLKYVLKGFNFEDSCDRENFKSSMKGVHYVRAYGYLYNYKTSPHVNFPCPRCGAVKCWVLLDFCKTVDLFEGVGYDPPMNELQRG